MVHGWCEIAGNEEQGRDFINILNTVTECHCGPSLHVGRSTEMLTIGHTHLLTFVFSFPFSNGTVGTHQISAGTLTQCSISILKYPCGAHENVETNPFSKQEVTSFRALPLGL